LRLAEESPGINGTGDDVQHAAVRSAEVRGDVAALLRAADDLERGDLLIGADEILVYVLPDFGIGQCAHTERFSGVSGEFRVFEVTGDVEEEDELFFLLGLLGGLLGAVLEEDTGAKIAGANGGRGFGGRRGSRRGGVGQAERPQPQRGRSQDGAGSHVYLLEQD